jgi:hypothetical protein
MTELNWNPEIEGQEVRLKDNFNRKGITTGQIKKSEESTLVEVNFGTNEQSYIFYDQLELIQEISRTKDLSALENKIPPDSTNKINAWSNLLSSIADLLKSFAPYLWALVVIVVIIPLIGQGIIANSFNSNKITPVKEIVIEKNQINWDKVDLAIRDSLELAHRNTNQYADEQLELWVDDLATRIDPDFLDWYFGYFNQKQIEYKGFFTVLKEGTLKLLKFSNKDVNEQIAEEITSDFQTEFAKRVLRPQIAQLQVERITNQIVRYYLNEVKTNVNNIAIKYQIPQTDWNNYLNDIAVSIYDTEGNISNTPFKVFAGAGAYVAVKPLIVKLVPTVSSKVVAKLAGKAGAKVATKTGGVLAGKIGGAFLDATVGVGIILWDVWDINHTAQIEKPILKENLINYLEEVKDSLLNNPQTGIMNIVDQIEESIVSSLT